jgi:hypothetical protein
MLTPQALRKRYDSAWNRKDNWRDLYEQCYKYGLPQRNLYGGYNEAKTGGRQKGGEVFDSTAVAGVQRFANRLQSGLFPPDKKWMDLQPGSDIPEEATDMVREGLQNYSDKFFSILRQTNFDLAMGEFLMDLCVGTGVMLVQKGDDLNPITFQAIPQYLVALEEGPYGTVENVYRKVRVPAENIQRQWPDAELPDKLLRLIEDKPQEPVDLQESTILDASDGSYGYYLCHKDDTDTSMLVYRKMKTSPWIVSRYMKVSGEVYGRGPMVQALADVMSLNKTVELLLKNASINISGIFTAVDDGVLNPQTIRIVPGAVIPVASNGGPRGPSLSPLPKAGDLQLSQLVLQDLRANVKKILLDDSLPPDNMSARSATEIVERMRELATNLGSAFGRLITETMVPIVRRSMAIMDDAGLITLPLKLNGLDVKVVPVSPLAQAQNLDDVQNTMQWVSIAGQLGPLGMATTKMDAISDYVADKLGVPMGLRTSMEERAQMEEMAQQAMMQEQQAQMQGGAPPPEGGAVEEG